MASRLLEVIIAAKDQASATLDKVRESTTGFGLKAQAMAKSVSDSLNSMVGRWLTVGGIVGILKTASDAANEFSASMRKLEGTAKIAGVPLETLQGIAAKGRDAFGLSAVTANDLTVAVSRLATKAGNLGMSSDLMERFLDLGAAKGLSATETLRAVEQSILGIDEGTDKLFGKNPSVLYKEFADSIGKSAGKLTDQEKAMALATAAMDDGGKVVGAYRDYLQSAAGQQEQARQRMREAAATLGTALTPAYNLAAGVVQWFGTKLQGAIGQVQLFAVQAALLTDGIGPMFKVVTGAVIAMLGDMFDKLRDLPVIGDLFGSVADKLKTSGQQMVRENKQTLTNIREVYQEESARIEGRQQESGKRQLQIAQQTNDGLLDNAEDTNNDLSQLDKDRAKERERLGEEIALKTLMLEEGLTEAQAKEFIRRKRLMGEAVTATVTDVKDGWARLDQLNLALGLSFDKEVTPKVKNTTQAIKDIKPASDDVTGALERLRTAAEDAGTKGEQKTRTFGESLKDIALKAEPTIRKVEELAAKMASIFSGDGSLMSKLGTLVGDIAKNLPGVAGSVARAVGATVEVIKGIFGESPEERARKELLKNNTAALKSLTKVTGDLAKLNSTGSEITKARDFLTSIFGPGGQYTKGAYTAAKLRTGMTDADFERLAGELGIQLRNKETGAIESKALYQLLQALNALDSGFANTFAGQRERISQEMAVGILRPEDQFDALKQVLGSASGSRALAAALGSGDITTAEGRAALTQSLQNVFKQFSAGGITAADLGGLTGSEFLSTIEELLGLIKEREDASASSTAKAQTESTDTASESVTPPAVLPPAEPVSVTFGTEEAAERAMNALMVPLTQYTSLLTSIDAGIHDVASSLNVGFNGLIERWTNVDTGAPGQMAGVVNITLGDMVVNTAATDAAGTGEAVQAAVTAAINQALADAYLDRQLATGNVTRTVT